MVNPQRKEVGWSGSKTMFKELNASSQERFI